MMYALATLAVVVGGFSLLVIALQAIALRKLLHQVRDQDEADRKLASFREVQYQARADAKARANEAWLASIEARKRDRSHS